MTAEVVLQPGSRSTRYAEALRYVSDQPVPYLERVEQGRGEASLWASQSDAWISH